MKSKRLQEIANNAGLAVSHSGIILTKNLPGGEALEQLMEDIVRECVRVVQEQRDPLNLNYKPSERTAEAIRQHFGLY